MSKLLVFLTCYHKKLFVVKNSILVCEKDHLPHEVHVSFIQEIE